jgi:hypothetical protein
LLLKTYVYCPCVWVKVNPIFSCLKIVQNHNHVMQEKSQIEDTSICGTDHCFYLMFDFLLSNDISLSTKQHDREQQED